jgi:hypothetical protein
MYPLPDPRYLALHAAGAKANGVSGVQGLRPRISVSVTGKKENSCRIQVPKTEDWSTRASGCRKNDKNNIRMYVSVFSKKENS